MVIEDQVLSTNCNNQAPRINNSGVSVSGLKSVVTNTAVVTKAGSASYSVPRMVDSTALGMDPSSTPARKHKKRPTTQICGAFCVYV